MKRMLFVGILSCATASVAAGDGPTAVRADMFLRGKLWPGVILSGGDAGWALPLTVPANAGTCMAYFRDISPGPLGRTDRSERIDTRTTRTVKLARSRYTANHVYRMSLRCGAWRSGETLVQLQPSVEEQRAWLAMPIDRIAKR